MECFLCGLPILDGEAAYRYRTFKGDGRDDVEVPELSVRGEHEACVAAGRKGQRLRITANGGDFSCATCVLIQPDGTEISLRDTVRAVTIRIADGELNAATVVFEGVELAIDGYLDPASEPISNHA